MKKSMVIAVAGILLLLVVADLVVDFKPEPLAKSVDKPAAGEALIGGAFNLTSQQGKPLSDKDFKGKYMLVFFGFSHCPSICPVAMANMSAALKQLHADDKIVPIFITIDPERDTPQQLTIFLKDFYPTFTGLTGTKEQIDATEAGYKVYASKVENKDAPKDYMMDHSGFIYLMDKDGKYLTNFTSDTAPDQLVAGIKKYL